MAPVKHLATILLALLLPATASGFCFEEARNEYGISPLLLWGIARHESGMNPAAIGRNSNGTYDYSMAFFDPKGDQEIVDVAKQCGRLGELMLVTPIYPEYSAIIDPMAYYFMVDELVGHVVSGIKGGKEPFFRNIAKDITLAVILSIRLIAEAEKKKPLLNFNELRKGIRRSSLKE